MKIHNKILNFIIVFSFLFYLPLKASAPESRTRGSAAVPGEGTRSRANSLGSESSLRPAGASAASPLVPGSVPLSAATPGASAASPVDVPPLLATFTGPVQLLLAEINGNKASFFGSPDVPDLVLTPVALTSALSRPGRAVREGMINIIARREGVPSQYNLLLTVSPPKEVRVVKRGAEKTVELKLLQAEVAANGEYSIRNIVKLKKDSLVLREGGPEARARLVADGWASIEYKTAKGRIKQVFIKDDLGEQAAEMAKTHTFTEAEQKNIFNYLLEFCTTQAWLCYDLKSENFLLKFRRDHSLQMSFIDYNDPTFTWDRIMPRDHRATLNILFPTLGEAPFTPRMLLSPLYKGSIINFLKGTYDPKSMFRFVTPDVTADMPVVLALAPRVFVPADLTGKTKAEQAAMVRAEYTLRYLASEMIYLFLGINRGDLPVTQRMLTSIMTDVVTRVAAREPLVSTPATLTFLEKLLRRINLFNRSPDSFDYNNPAIFNGAEEMQ